MPARLSSMELSPASNPDAHSTVQPSRRKSGRVSKQTEFLSSGAPKRKRDDARGSDDDEDDESESDDDNDDDPDEEELREQRRRKRATAASKPKPAPAKKSKPNGTNALPIRSRPSRPAKSKARVGAIASAKDVGGLFGRVYGGDHTMETVAAGWLQSFEEHEPQAMVQLVNFTLRSCGCTIEVDENDILDVDNVSSRLSDIQDEFQAQNITEYPIIAKEKSSQTFRQNLGRFFNVLIHSMSAKGLVTGNEDLMNNLISWVAVMTSAASRPFRHTATVISLEITGALAELCRGYVDAEAKARRQADGEQKNKKVNRARVKEVEQAAAQAADSRKQVEKHISDWFDSVFLHRYRDIDPRIRVDCVTSLSGWINTFPEFFLDGAHLRYLGWMLSDTAAATRLEVVKQLRGIFQDEENLGGLKQFTERFRSRMVEMATRDGELNVRCSAIDLLSTLRQHGLLEPDDIDTVGKLIFDADPRIRKAVVPFFAANVQDTCQAKEEEIDAEALEEFRSSEDDAIESPKADWLMFKSLAELMQLYDTEDEVAVLDPKTGHFDDVTSFIHSRVSLATEAVFDRLPALKNWDALAGFLLADLSRPAAQADEVAVQVCEQSKLEDKEEAILLDVLNVSVKQKLVDSSDSATHKKANKTKAQQLELLDDQDSASQQLATLIPRLLNKYGSAPETASAVLRLEHSLNVGLFHAAEQGNATYAELLKEINGQFLNHESSNVINEAKTALLHAKSYEELQEITEGRLEALWEDTVFSMGQQLYPVRTDISKRCNLELLHLSQLSATLLRIENLSSISDCCAWLESERPIVGSKKDKKNVWNVRPLDALISVLGRGAKSTGRGGSVSRVLQNNTEMSEIEDTIVSHALRILLFYFMWKMLALQNSSAGAASQKNINGLVDIRDRLMSSCRAIIRDRQAAEPLRVNVAGILLEFATLLSTSKTLSGRAAELSKLGDNGDKALPEKHRRAILSVLSAAEQDLARKTGKSLSTTSDSQDDAPSSDEDDNAQGNDADDDINADPLSSDDEEEVDPDAPADAPAASQLASSQARAQRRQRAELLAEQALCALAGKLVLALAGGVFGGGAADAHARTRLRRNATRLGPNYRDVVGMLDAGDGSKKARRGAAGGAAKKGGKAAAAVPLSTERVEEDIDDDEGDAPVEEDGEEDLRRRGLLDEEMVDEEHESAAGGAADDDIESVIGD